MEGQAISDALAVLACVLGWFGWALLIGWLANRLPSSALDHDTWLTRARPWPQSEAGYEKRLAILRWKSLLPDAGDALPGGVRKNSLVSRDPAALQRLVEETRRAELVHLAIWPFWLCTALWMPPAGVLVNMIFATLFNLPCLLLQRYNRLRLARTLLHIQVSPGHQNRATAP
jgi:glycosyl-4,4'-diaponeurosporenoate acyltransferase